MKVKMCGIQTIEDVALMNRYMPDAIGFICVKNRTRYVKKSELQKMLCLVNPTIQTVGVFQKASDYEKEYRAFPFDYIQVYNVDVEPSIPFIHAVSDVKKAHHLAEYVLLDRSHGRGKVTTYENVTTPKKLGIAGGVNAENVSSMIERYAPDMIDVSSSIERDGKKDPAFVRQFLEAARPVSFGGAYVPETFIPALQELERGFQVIQRDEQFRKLFLHELQTYVGRPTSLYEAKSLRKPNGPRILLKREDLNHTGAHKINNAIGQVLLAKRLGKTHILAETGAGQHGVATATACAKYGLKCTIFMGEKDMKRQEMNVFRMRLLGAEVVGVGGQEGTLKHAVTEALRIWATYVDTTHYVIGSALGPEPFPAIVRYFQSIIGEETKKQMIATYGTLPTALVAVVGGGSNAIGLFDAFLQDPVHLYGVEAGGTKTKHAAVMRERSVGVLHGTKTFILQDEEGNIRPTHSISAGLDYPGIGPDHATLAQASRVTYDEVTDEEALAAFYTLSEKEGILPALESAHAVAYALKIAPQFSTDESIVVSLSGRGDKDVQQVFERGRAE